MPIKDSCADCRFGQRIFDVGGGSERACEHTAASHRIAELERENGNCGVTARNYKPMISTPSAHAKHLKQCFDCVHCAAPGSSLSICHADGTTHRIETERRFGKGCGPEAKLFISRLTDGQQVARALAESIV